MNKKGLELSVTIIVLLVLSLLIFILAISFLWNWYGKAESFKAEIDRQSEEQILAALRQGNALVAVPINVQSTERGGAATFGAGVRNVASPKSFSGLLSFSSAFYPDGRRNTETDQNYIEEHWLGNFKEILPFSLGRNEQKIIPVLIKAANKVSDRRQTEKGDYVFNLCIFDKPSPGTCSADILDQTYSGRIYQLTVRVK